METSIKSVIEKGGGQTAFSKLHGIPLRTVQSWAGGYRHPPVWLVTILNKIT